MAHGMVDQQIPSRTGGRGMIFPMIGHFTLMKLTRYYDEHGNLDACFEVFDHHELVEAMEAAKHISAMNQGSEDLMDEVVGKIQERLNMDDTMIVVKKGGDAS